MRLAPVVPLFLAACASAPERPEVAFLHHLEREEVALSLVPAEPVAESSLLRAPFLFDELLVSWNADVEEPLGVRFEVRVGRRADGFWSPWLHVADFGEVSRAPGPREFAGGGIDIDFFRSSGKRFDRAQLRAEAFFPEAPEGEEPTGEVLVRRVAVCFTRRDTPGAEGADDERAAEAQVQEAASRAESVRETQPPSAVRLDVPFRSQRDEGELAARVCSPTSLAMVLEYYGVDCSTAEVAARTYDAAHDIYGNWPRAVQAAYSFGVPGYLARFSSWAEVAPVLAAGQPLIVSIRTGEGELTGAPYAATNGHLIVLVGFDEEGRVLVNDPAAATVEAGQLAYDQGELGQAWFGRGGTAYVLLPPVE